MAQDVEHPNELTLQGEEMDDASLVDESLDIPPLTRFFRGATLLGQTMTVEGQNLVQHALAAEVDIPTNCTSGTCGACMLTLVSGEVPLPEPLPPGLDDFLIEEGARLGCIGMPKGDVDIDILPPI